MDRSQPCAIARRRRPRCRKETSDHGAKSAEPKPSRKWRSNWSKHWGGTRTFARAVDRFEKIANHGLHPCWQEGSPVSRSARRTVPCLGYDRMARRRRRRQLAPSRCERVAYPKGTHSKTSAQSRSSFHKLFRRSRKFGELQMAENFGTPSARFIKTMHHEMQRQRVSRSGSDYALYDRSDTSAHRIVGRVLARALTQRSREISI
jgi:hypothetical protein